MTSSKFCFQSRFYAPTSAPAGPFTAHANVLTWQMLFLTSNCYCIHPVNVPRAVNCFTKHLPQFNVRNIVHAFFLGEATQFRVGKSCTEESEYCSSWKGSNQDNTEILEHGLQLHTFISFSSRSILHIEHLPWCSLFQQHNVQNWQGRPCICFKQGTLQSFCFLTFLSSSMFAP